MKKHTGWAIASALLVGSIGSALAADMPLKALPPVVPVMTWTGCYIGVNAGGIFDGGRDSLAQGGDFLLPGNLFSNPANTITSSYNSRGSGFTGGGQVGCNWQSGPSFVWGVEADINGSSRLSTSNSFGPVGPIVGGGGLLAASRTETVTDQPNWFSTFRGRVGFLASPTLLLYGTGGLAVAGVNSSTNVNFRADQFFLNSFNFAGSANSTRVGAAVGVGAEWMFAPHWSVKAEYLYMDFGKFSYNSPCTGPIAAGACPAGSNFLWTTNVREQENVVRVGVNYHFH